MSVEGVNGMTPVQRFHAETARIQQEAQVAVAEPASTGKSRIEILDMAKACVSKDRQATYGPPEQSFQRTANLWNAHLADKLNVELSAVDVTVLLALLKVARIASSPEHRDNWIDLAGYAACGGELATAPKTDVATRTAQPARGGTAWY